MNLKNNRVTLRALLESPSLAFKCGVRISLIVTALFVGYNTAATTAAQEAITGEWIINAKPGTDSVHLTIQRNEGRHMNMNSTDNIRPESIRGLSQAMMAGSGSPVQFQIVRDAGTFDCEGWFKAGRGSGHFTFTPSQSFVSEMQSLGYNNLSNEKVFSMAVLDVSRAFVRDLSALGYERLPVDQLIAMRIHGASPQFIGE
jgi:hypothetical protein